MRGRILLHHGVEIEAVPEPDPAVPTVPAARHIQPDPPVLEISVPTVALKLLLNPTKLTL